MDERAFGQPITTGLYNETIRLMREFTHDLPYALRLLRSNHRTFPPVRQIAYRAWSVHSCGRISNGDRDKLTAIVAWQ